MYAEKKKVLVIVGPTAVGKSSLAIQLAKQVNAEIISADSRQFYSEMHIGTARLLPTEWEGVPHHLMGHTSIHKPYDVGIFSKEAHASIENIHSKNKNVIVVGGSGLYIKSLTDGLDEFPDVPAHIRTDLNQKFANLGLEWLQEEVKRLDPNYALHVDLSNPQRLIRCLEISLTTGHPYSSFKTGVKKESPYTFIKIGVDLPREVLYSRIHDRVDQMMQQGLEQEARTMYVFKDHQALQTVGYKEWFDAWDGILPVKEVVDKIKQHTRNYAKRQGTWFKKDVEIAWFSPLDIDTIQKYIFKEGFKE